MKPYQWFLHMLMIGLHIIMDGLDVFVICGELGPVSNVSKHLWFPDFKMEHRVNHEIRLIGNAGLVDDSGIIQIPTMNSPDQNMSFQAGKALYSSPVRMLDPSTGTPASFHTTFTFQMNPVSDQSNDYGSSGMAFVVVPDELTVGRPGGWLGMLNDACDENYKAFAVEFDTFRNVEFGDPNDNHVGINLGSVVSNITLDAADAGVTLKSGSTVRAWIDYDGPKKWIQVKLAKDAGDVPKKPLYSAGLDLSSFLNEYMFVGFSASTGHAAQVHNILSWNFSTVSNAYLRLPRETTCQVNMLKDPKMAQKEPPGAFLIFVAGAALFLAALVYLLWSRKAQSQTRTILSKLTLNKTKVRPRPPNKPRRFGISELTIATRSFSETEILGSGDKGVVYKGTLQNGSTVAIKRFSKEFLQGNVDKNKVLKEVKLLCKLKHPNLVLLKGWSHDKGELVMVYEYMQNGSLDKWLFARGVLPWPRRYKVIKDVAEGIEFLHRGRERSLVHKNIKTSNVLLDITFRARLGDFGLSNYCVNDCQQEKLKKEEQNHFAPESTYVLQPNEKMDVYSFGIMILEVISGRKSLETALGPEEADLVQLAWNLRGNEKLCELADKRLMMRYNPEQVTCLASIALLCTYMDPKARPTMTKVIQYINGELKLPPLPSCRPVAFYLYPSAPELCMKSCTPTSLQLLGYKTSK